MEIELDQETVSQVLGLLSEAEDGSEGLSLEEQTTNVKKVTGQVLLTGFDNEVMGGIKDEIKFRLRASKFGGRVRIILDLSI